MNKYKPWAESGITELEYYKERYLVASRALEIAREVLECFVVLSPFTYTSDRVKLARSALDKMDALTHRRAGGYPALENE